MSALLDTSIIIPYLGDVAYARFLWRLLVREQVYICAVSGMELLAGSLTPDQRRKALAFIDRLDRQSRVIIPIQSEWLRVGTILARFQNRFGHAEPADHENDILILLTAERLGASLVTENGIHFRTWSRFLAPNRRPELIVLDRREHLNRSSSPGGDRPL